MSYFLADANGPLDEFASIGGLADFYAWARTHDGSLGQLAREGFTEDLTGLDDILGRVPVPVEVLEQVEVLDHWVRRADSILIISDGMSDEEARALASKETAVHAAADAHQEKLAITMRYAFAMGRRALGHPPNIDAAIHAIKAALKRTLPKALLKIVIDGGEAGLSLLHVKTLGGQGSGNFGHAGRPGEVGGSAEGVNLYAHISPTGETDFDGLTAGQSAVLARAVRREGKRLYHLSFETGDIHETITFIDAKTGQTILDQPVHGETLSVDIPEDVVDLIHERAAETDVIGIHTHPSGSAFSTADFDQTIGAQLKGAIVISKDGSSYELMIRRQPDVFETPTLRDDLNEQLKFARQETLLKTDDYVRTNFNTTASSHFERAALVKLHPEIESIHLNYWIDSADRAWRRFANNHVNILSYRRVPPKSAAQSTRVQKAAMRTAAARTSGYMLDDTETISVYALDGNSPRRALRTADDPIKIRFDAKNQAAIDWADRHAAELVTHISETTREDINNAIAEALESGDFDAAYDKIFDAVGNDNRAALIARHETMLAASEGQRQAWNQAVEDGLLTGDEKRTWITVGDEKVCPICEELDGAVTDLDGQYPGEGGDGPPAHVACRCTEGITNG